MRSGAREGSHLGGTTTSVDVKRKESHLFTEKATSTTLIDQLFFWKTSQMQKIFFRFISWDSFGDGNGMNFISLYLLGGIP